MQRLILIIIANAWLLTGCMMPTSSPTSDPPTEDVYNTPNTQPDRIQALLNEADRALHDNRLTTPVDDNAYLRYSQVLSKEPNNPDALLGLQRIVDTYLAWSIQAIETGQYRRATNMLNKARSVDELHPSIAALETRINSAKNSTHDVYRLDPSALKNRTDTLVGQLHELGRKAEINAAKVRIISRSDADGRWIYQQLNEASLNRIRATIELGRPARIQLIYP